MPFALATKMATSDAGSRQPLYYPDIRQPLIHRYTCRLEVLGDGPCRLLRPRSSGRPMRGADPESFEQTAHWEREGVSRATWYRRRQRAAACETE